MILIIDGYNLIHAIPSFEKELDRNLRAARESVISFCRDYRASRGDIEKIVIVFDGSSEVFFPQEAKPVGLELVYTETHEDADDRIIAILSSRKGKGPVAVVSGDNYIANNARALGAGVISPASFFAAARKKKIRAAGPGGGTAGNIPRSVADKITAEYRKILGLE